MSEIPDVDISRPRYKNPKDTIFFVLSFFFFFIRKSGYSLYTGAAYTPANKVYIIAYM